MLVGETVLNNVIYQKKQLQNPANPGFLNSPPQAPKKLKYFHPYFGSWEKINKYFPTIWKEKSTPLENGPKNSRGSFGFKLDFFFKEKT